MASYVTVIGYIAFLIAAGSSCKVNRATTDCSCDAQIQQLTDRVAQLETQLGHQANLEERVIKAEKNLDYLTNRGHCYRGMQRDMHNKYRSVEIDLERQQYAMCDTMTDNGGWIVIQRRGGYIDENFRRPWQEDVVGFGEIDADQWIGLDTIHKLSHKGSNELWIDLKFNDSDTEYTAVYTNFRVGNSSTNYVMTYESYIGGPNPVEDALTNHQNMPFTTYDNDNDNNADGNCAQIHSGGWWYNDCYSANLNGQPGENSAQGIFWKNYPVSYSEMKIRIYADW